MDLVWQADTPNFFWTFALHEPYHEFVSDEMRKKLSRRLRRRVAETPHSTHLLVQITKGFLLGINSNVKRRNKLRSHLLSTKGGQLHTFLSLEIQDGYRKEPTQDYHGSGRVHLHLLGFADDTAMSEIPWVQL